MNHDDEKNPDLQAWIEPELEARLVAAVLGEASAFEAAELERLIGEKPELGIFKRRIEAVHGLIGRAERPEQAPLRLAPERRAKILQTIGVTSARPPGADKNAPVLLKLAAARRKRRKQWIWAGGLAASVMFAAILTVRTTRRIYESSQDKAALNNARQLATPVDQTLMEPGREASKGGNEFAQFGSLEGQKKYSFDAPQPPSITSGLRKAQALSPPAQLDAVDSVREPARAEASRQSPTSFYTSRPAAPLPEGETRRYFDSAGRQDNDTVGGHDAEAITQQKFSAESKPVDEKSDAGKPSENDMSAVIALSPFEIKSSKDKGYFSAQSLAGSRLNSKLEDLASSASVVTKQQLADGAAVDINDLFKNDGFLSGSTRDISPTLTAMGPTPAGNSPAEEDQRLSQEKIATAPAPKPPTAAASPRSEISAAQEAVSTFSLHVSDVSFRLAQAALARGETPDPERIRPEEFYNAFDYGDPSPTLADKIVCRIEQSAHPLIQQRNLVRIAMKVPSAGRGAGQPLNLTVLLDTSGSMEREDRIASVHRALEVLASLLGAHDRVTLIGFARQPRLLAEQLPGDQAAKLAELASHTPFTGGTNLEEALKLSDEVARRHRDPAAQNRIVLITDGAANLGNADPAQLATLIETLRQQGIAFDACGVGTDGLDDAILESLTRQGDGRYYVLDKPEDADAGFARQLAGAFRPAAENVKVQVRFNPARVGHYRLIGFEQHRLREEDFRNDQVDAAELAADEAAIALYQVEVLPQGEGELGEVFVRFRDAATGGMVERSWTMRHEPQALAFDRATPTMQLAGMAALLAEKLQGGDSAKLVNLAELAPVVNGLRGHYANDARVQELIAMFEQMRRRDGK